MEQLKSIEEIHRNLKKTPNRPYSKETNLQKLRTLQNLKREFIEATKNEKDSKELSKLKNTYVTVKAIIAENLAKQTEEEEEEKYNTEEEIIAENLAKQTKEEEEEKDNTEEEIEDLEKTIEMSDFKIETAMKAIPLFNGNFKELDGFLKITELINNSLNTAGKAELLELVFHVKLSTKVKTAIGIYSPPTSFDNLTTLLKERYKSNITLPQILNKLSCLTQGNQSVTSFKDRITESISELNKLQIAELGNTASTTQKEVVTQINNTQALHIFKNGLNGKIQTTVLAAQPRTFIDAVNIALEVENNNHNSSIMYFNTNRQRNYNTNRNFQNYNNRYTGNNRNHQNTNAHHNNRYWNNNNNNRNYNHKNTNRNNNKNTQHYQNNNRNFHNNNNRNNNTSNPFRNSQARVHVTNYQGNGQGSDYQNPDSQT